jgi:hypothetical protein
MSDAALVTIASMLIAGTVTLGIVAMVYGRPLSLGFGKKLAMKIEGKKAAGKPAAPSATDTPKLKSVADS